MFFNYFQKSDFFAFQCFLHVVVQKDFEKPVKNTYFSNKKSFKKAFILESKNHQFLTKKASKFALKITSPKKVEKIAFSDDFGRPNWHFFGTFLRFFAC